MRIPSPLEVALPLGVALFRVLRLALLATSGIVVVVGLIPIALLATIEVAYAHMLSRRADREVAAMGDRPDPDAGEPS